ncbi:MAG: threonine/serine dehydratase [Actinobacteria bacterium]|nr:MAG: threonine/serine dehydratase [Actinomycetota bacterium]
MTTHRLSIENIERSARTIDPVFLHSPQYNCEALSAELGCELTLKVEMLNPIRSFKGRGADFFMHENAQALNGRDLVCATAGNFGQAMAFVCRAHKRSLIIYCATNASPLKVDRMRSMGAEVRQMGDNFDAAKENAKKFCSDTGAYFVEDGRDIAISEGAGSIAVELMQQRTFDAVLVPLGNGALIGGVSRYIKHVAPEVQIIGVSSATADAMEASWRSGTVINRPSTNTIADGIAVRTPVPEALNDMKGLVDDVLLVSEDALQQAMRIVFDKAGLTTEPAGVAGVSAILEHAHLKKMRLATILCGSNLTSAQVNDWLIDKV